MHSSDSTSKQIPSNMHAEGRQRVTELARPACFTEQAAGTLPFTISKLHEILQRYWYLILIKHLWPQLFRERLFSWLCTGVPTLVASKRLKLLVKLYCSCYWESSHLSVVVVVRSHSKTAAVLNPHIKNQVTTCVIRWNYIIEQLEQTVNYKAQSTYYTAAN